MSVPDRGRQGTEHLCRARPGPCAEARYAEFGQSDQCYHAAYLHGYGCPAAA